MVIHMRSRRAGMTIVELLLVIAILGVVLGLGSMMFTRQNEVVTLESAASELSQTIGQARSRALQRGNEHRVRIISSTNYVLETFDGSSWETDRSVALPAGVTLVVPASGSSVTFDTRGFADFDPAGVVFTMSDGSGQRTVVPAMTGTTRVQ